MKIFFLFCLIVLISFSARSQNLITIETKNSSLVFAVRDQKLRQIYLGEKLPSAESLVNFPQSFSAYSTFGTDEVNEVALRATHLKIESGNCLREVGL